MEIENEQPLEDTGGLSDSSDIDTEIENANRGTNKRGRIIPDGSDDEESDLRSKSPRFDEVVSPATVVNSLEMEAQFEFLLNDFSNESISNDSNDSDINPETENSIFFKEILSFCKRWNGYITGAVALAVALDSLEIERSLRNSHVVWKPGKIEDGASLDIIFIVPRDKSYSTPDSNYNVNSILESFSVYFTKHKKYFVAENDLKSKIDNIEIINKNISRELRETKENLRDLRASASNSNHFVKNVIRRMNSRIEDKQYELSQNVSILDKLYEKVAKLRQYCNNNRLYDDDDSDKDCVTMSFKSDSKSIAFDVQLIFYYKRGLTQKDRQTFPQYENENDISIKTHIQKLFIEEAVQKIYNYRMLHCYLDFSNNDTLIKFNNKDCKENIISKRIVIVDDPYQNYNSCLKSIIQSIKYYEKDFTPKSPRVWMGAISQINPDDELKKFIQSQRYRLLRSINVTYTNISNQRYDVLQSRFIPDPHDYNRIVIGSYENQAEVLNEEELDKLRYECEQRGLISSQMNTNPYKDDDEIDIIYQIPNYNKYSISGWVKVTFIRKYNDAEDFIGWYAHIEEFKKLGELETTSFEYNTKTGEREKVSDIKKLINKKNNDYNPKSKFVFPRDFNLELAVRNPFIFPKQIFSFIDYLFKLNDKLFAETYFDKGLYDFFPKLKLYRNLHYYEFDPKIVNNEITILTNSNDEKHEQALCKTVTYIKNYLNNHNKDAQILKIKEGDNRYGHTPMKSLNSLDEVFKPFTEFFKTIDIQSRPPSGKLSYLQIFAEQYDLAMNDKKVEFYDGPNLWPISFFEDDYYEGENDEDVKRVKRQYEFFLPENENIDSTDVIDHGGILKRFFTGLNNDFKFLVKTSYENKILFDNKREVLIKATYPKGSPNNIISRREVAEDYVGDVSPPADRLRHFTEYPYEIMLLIILKFAKNHKAQQIIKLDDDLLNMIFNTVNIKIPYTKIISASGIVSHPNNIGSNNSINTQIICRLIQEMGCGEYEKHDLEGYNEMFSPNKLTFTKKLGSFDNHLIFTPYLNAMSGDYNFHPRHHPSTTNALRKQIPKSSHANTVILLLNQFIETKEYTLKQFEVRLINFFENIIRIIFWKTAYSDLNANPPRHPKFVHTEEYSFFINEILNPSFDTIKINSVDGKEYIKSKIYLDTSNDDSVEMQLQLRTVNNAFQRMDPNHRSALARAVNVNDDDLDLYVQNTGLTYDNEFTNLYAEIQRIFPYRLNIDVEDINNITKKNMIKYLDELSIDDKQHPNLEDFLLFVTNTNGFPQTIKYTLDPNQSSPVRNGVTRYPSSHTCWNELELPWYIDIFDTRYSYEQFKELLDYSILNQSNIWKTNLQYSENVEMQDANVSSQGNQSPTVGGNKNDKPLLKYVGYW